MAGVIRLSTLTAAIAVLLAAAGSGLATESLRGPIDGKVVRAIDGDTLEFVAHVWLGLELTTAVRVRGIDAPEVNGACLTEKELARQATQRLSELTASGVVITNVADDKYFGRVTADVTTLSGTDVGTAMIRSGPARPYDGGARVPWCAITPAVVNR
jgi:endonuclease YncB( thermonuclease family)